MPKDSTSGPEGSAPAAVSRRKVLAGAVATALVAATPVALASRQPSKRANSKAATTASTNLPVRRYMAAAALMGDGRVLLTGGYNQPWDGTGPAPTPLRSAVIYDPGSGQWSPAPSMRVGRARHAAVSLSDGRVAVLGGMTMQPTASVEVFDPRAGEWQAAEPMSQPRFDHVAVSDGHTIYVLGGSCLGMVSSVEICAVRALSSISPE